MSKTNDSPQTLRDWLAQEPFTLSLSAGFFGFYAHSGFLTALAESGLRPIAVRGCSAGALVGGLWTSGRTTEDLSRVLLSVRRQDFWDPGFGLGLLIGDLFRQILERELGVVQFAHTELPFVVSVYDLVSRSTKSLTEGKLAPAIQASCTFPGLFHPVRISGRLYIDGGVRDRAGHHGLMPGTRVLYHHLSSRSRTRKNITHSMARIDENMVTMVCRGLPAVGPFHMERGQDAYNMAYEGFREALDAPVREAAVMGFGPDQ